MELELTNEEKEELSNALRGLLARIVNDIVEDIRRREPVSGDLVDLWSPSLRRVSRGMDIANVTRRQGYGR